jgi:AcrR family transcriptional regulator
MPRDSSDTRARLLAAARDEFAAFGIGGARVDRIAEKAGVNKERIYGHFGNKESLFKTVVAEATEEHTAALGQPTEDLAEYFRRIYDFHRDHPQLLRLLMWEALHYGAQSPDEPRRVTHYEDKVGALADSLGTEPDADAAVGLIALIGLAAWPHALPQLTRLIMGAGGVSEAPERMHDTVRERLVAIARKALTPGEDSQTHPAPVR